MLQAPCVTIFYSFINSSAFLVTNQTLLFDSAWAGKKVLNHKQLTCSSNVQAVHPASQPQASPELVSLMKVQCFMLCVCVSSLCCCLCCLSCSSSSD